MDGWMGILFLSKSLISHFKKCIKRLVVYAEKH